MFSTTRMIEFCYIFVYYYSMANENYGGGYALEEQSRRMQEQAESAREEDMYYEPIPTLESVRVRDEGTPNTELYIQEIDKTQTLAFKACFHLERTREMTSGMMYRPGQARIMQAYEDLFKDNGGAMTSEQVEELRQQIGNVMRALSEFNERLRVRYDTSYMRIDTRYPTTLCGFSDPYGTTGENSTPYASVFYNKGGKLEYRLARGQDVGKEAGVKAGDIEYLYKGVETGSLGNFRLTEETATALKSYLYSAKFKENWDSMHEKLPYSPKSTVDEI